MERAACARAAMMVIISWSLREAKPLCLHLLKRCFGHNPGRGRYLAGDGARGPLSQRVATALGSRPNNSSAASSPWGLSSARLPAEAAGRPGSPGAGGQGSPLHTARCRAGGPKSKVNFLCGLRQVLSLSGPPFPFCKGPCLQAADEK